MADPKPDPSSNSLSGGADENVKAPNVFERAKEEFEAILHTEKQSHHHHKETHGLRDDIDENTPTSDIKGPNVFERAKEEIEAIVQAVHPKKESKSHGSPSNGERRDGAAVSESKHEMSNSCSGKLDVKAPNPNGRGKEQMEGAHKEKSQHHHKETHGMSDDIDVNMPISEFKGPNVFERAKEEFEALVQTIRPKKEPDSVVLSPKKEGGGLCATLGRGLQKVCSPGSHKKD